MLPYGQSDQQDSADQAEDKEPAGQSDQTAGEEESELAGESGSADTPELVEGVDYDLYQPSRSDETMEMIAEQNDISLEAKMLANPDIANGTVSLEPGTVVVIPLQGEYLAELEEQAAAMQEVPEVEFAQIIVPEGASYSLYEYSEKYDVSL